ncbi:MAG: cation:proton antiporter [Myxococcota bacterium]|nr:cation:proton antiporter [Myxococcota bacterium]
MLRESGSSACSYTDRTGGDIIDSLLLRDIVLLLGLTAAGLALFGRLRLPAIAGCLAAGAIAGPGILGRAGLPEGLLPDAERVRALAEIGVVFLLFEIGLELPLDRLRRLWRSAVIAGSTQVVVTMTLVAGSAMLLGWDAAPSIILGGLVAMSSTALVMRQLADRGQVDSPHGQLAVSILILQDLSIVPLLLIIPLLATSGTSSPVALGLSILELVLALGIVLAVVSYVVPRVLALAARARSSDLFSLLAVLVVLGSAFFAEQLGLTLAVGAFLAGVAASTSPYAHQLFSEVVPLRGVFLGIFFTAVGMLFDPRVLVDHTTFVVLYLVAALALKGSIVALAGSLLLRQSSRIGVMAGLTLAQTGEFTFVLAEAARQAGLIEEWLHQGVIAGSILSLMATPFLIRTAPKVGDWVSGGRALDDGNAPPALDDSADDDSADRSSGRVLLIGFGIGGQTTARLCRSLGIEYVIVEANALGAERARARGEPVVFGDATRPQVLQRLNVGHARLVIIATSDPLATRRIVSRIRAISQDVPILARTRYVLEVDPLEAAGATAVVAEEFEGSIELVSRTLHLFGFPDTSIQKFTEALREDGYGAIRSDLGIGLDPWLTEILQAVDAQWIEIPTSFADGTSLVELDVRAATGATILAVDRDDVSTANPAPTLELRRGDRLLVLGDAAILAKLEDLLAGRAAD